jgi:hypothetical protein
MNSVAGFDPPGVIVTDPEETVTMSASTFVNTNGWSSRSVNAVRS